MLTLSLESEVGNTVSSFFTPDFPPLRFSIELDPFTAQHSATVHGVKCVPAETLARTNMYELDQSAEMCIVGEAGDLRIWEKIAQCNLLGLVASPSCPPWSSASRQGGLNDELGLNMIDMICVLKHTQPVLAAFENVGGLLSHEAHWMWLKELIRWAGFVILHEGLEDISQCRPICRKRSVVLLVRNDAVHARVLQPFLEKTKMPVVRDCNLGNCGALFLDMPWNEKKDLFLNAEEVAVVMNPAFLKSWQKQQVQDGTCSVEFFRVLNESSTCPALMASYRANLQFSGEYLSEKGLMFFTIRDQETNQLRCLHPLEFAAILGFPRTVAVPVDCEAAYRMIGNAFAPVHTAVVWHKLATVFSYIKQEVMLTKSIHQAFAQFADKLIDFRSDEVVHCEAGLTVKPRSTEVSPTLPFSVVEAHSPIRCTQADSFLRESSTVNGRKRAREQEVRPSMLDLYEIFEKRHRADCRNDMHIWLTIDLATKHKVRECLLISGSQLAPVHLPRPLSPSVEPFSTSVHGEFQVSFHTPERDWAWKGSAFAGETVGQ